MRGWKTAGPARAACAARCCAWETLRWQYGCGERRSPMDHSMVPLTGILVPVSLLGAVVVRSPETQAYQSSQP